MMSEQDAESSDHLLLHCPDAASKIVEDDPSDLDQFRFL
jgi:hypothetical protein